MKRCNNKDCHVSTGLGGELTAGTGLDSNGYFDKPCLQCENYFDTRDRFDEIYSARRPYRKRDDIMKAEEQIYHVSSNNDGYFAMIGITSAYHEARRLVGEDE